jgi:hypothetical protein
MMHTTQALYDALNAHNLVLDKQIENVTKEAEKHIGEWPYAEGQTVYDQRTRDGKPVLAELLAAKAQVLSGMAVLKAADMNSKAPRPGPRR